MNKAHEALKAAIEALEMASEDAKEWAMQYVTSDNAPITVRQYVADKAEPALNQLKSALSEIENSEPVGDEWTPCMKLPIVVHVRKQREGEIHVSTREGLTPILPSDLIMLGVSGEEYPIGKDVFDNTYTFNTSPISKECELDEIREIIANHYPMANSLSHSHCQDMLASILNRINEYESKQLRAEKG